MAALAAAALALASLLLADAAIESAVRAAWQEVESYWELLEQGKVTEADDPQRRLGRELYRHYLDRPGTKAGARALESAFTLWSNAGALDEIEQALPRIDHRSEVWSRILISTASAYHAGGRERDYRALCRRLEKRLAHPRARAELLLDLGDRFTREGKERSARRRYEEVLRLGADRFQVRRAEGNLYEMESLRVRRQAPDFEAVDLDGKRLRLSEARGSVVLLEFWATTCPPCLAELQALRDLYARNAGTDFRLLSISLDAEASDLRTFLAREWLPWPQILVEGEWTSALARLYNVQWIPRAYLLDRRGRIAGKDLRGKELEKSVARLLRK